MSDRGKKEKEQNSYKVSLQIKMENISMKANAEETVRA